MPVIIGHSQVKYFAEYMDPEEFTVFAYPGYRTRQFLEEDVLKTVLPFHSVVVLVVGANDIGRGNPERVMTGIEELSEMVRQYSPSSTLLVSEILPRGQNLFAGSMLSEGMLQRWYWEAAAVNRLLHEYASRREDVEIIPQSDFHTTFGVHRRLLSRDGLHLSFTGTETFVSKLAIGMEDPKDNKKYNLHQLRKNGRPKNKKKCGTKKGRRGDTDGDVSINPAPDSAMKSHCFDEVFDTPTNKNTQKNKNTMEKAKKNLIFGSTPKSILKDKPTKRKIPKSTGKKRKLQFKDDSDNYVKLPKLDTSDSINEDIIDIEQLDRKDVDCQFWLENLNLSINDKEDLTSNRKLNSNHMEAFNILLRKQFGESINGFQYTDTVPFYDESQKNGL